jgi:hypothetical protein
MSLCCDKCKTPVPLKAMIEEVMRHYNRRRENTSNAGRRKKLYRCSNCRVYLVGYYEWRGHQASCPKRGI